MGCVSEAQGDASVFNALEFIDSSDLFGNTSLENIFRKRSTFSLTNLFVRRGEELTD